MADGKQWFKVWASILIDPGMEELHNQDIGIWTRLGALVAAHGEKGTIKISLPQFMKRTHLTTADNVTIQEKINALKTINCDVVICHDVVTVTFNKWYKYQVDSTYLERQKKHRNVTMQEEKRREEKRRDNTGTKRKVFQQPSLDEITAYCKERNNSIDPHRWLAFYQSNGWRVGKNPMKDWRAAIRTWEANNPPKEGRFRPSVVPEWKK